MYIHLRKDDVFKAVLQYLGIQGQDEKFFVSEIDFSQNDDGNGIDGVRIHLEPKRQEVRTPLFYRWG